MKIAIVLLGTALFLAGCAGNPYEKFYQATPGATPEMVAQRRVAPVPDRPELIHGSNPKADIPAQLADGYAVIGVSSFHGPQARDRDTLKQAESVGADRVIAYSQYTRTVQTEVPLTVPTTQTSITNGSATAFGTGGTATAYGTAFTTSYGSQTTFVPMSIDQYDFLAVYLVKMKQAFGAFYRNLNPEESQEAASVNGVVLTAVTHGTAAAAAGFLPGDVVRSIDGRPVTDVFGFGADLQHMQGQRVTIAVRRNGKALDLPVTIGSYEVGNGDPAQPATTSSALQADNAQSMARAEPVSSTEPPSQVASQNSAPRAAEVCSRQDRELAQMAKKNGFQYSGQCADSRR